MPEMAQGGHNGAGGFAALLEAALRRAAGDGVRFSAGSSDLETAHFAPDTAEGQEARKNALNPFESNPVCERHPGEPRGESGLSYFLDGVQSTREVCRVGTVPVVAVTVAAAVVRRENRRLHRFPLDGVPEVVRAVVLPGRTEDPQAQAIFAAAREALPLMEDASDVPEDTPAGLVDSTRYDPEVDPGDYAGLKTRAYVRARALRESLEAELLRRWSRSAPDDGWIAVDGQLPVDEPRGIGLIKSSTRPFLRGDETRMLLDLRPGCRTTAFVPPWRAERSDAGHTEEERASWYVRMWPPGNPGTGEWSDATSGLVRVEAASDAGWSPEQYDEISRWILSERAPLAKPDPRWPSMIHPVHYLEKILKPLVNGGRRSQARIDRLLAELAS
jgi:hypothetical protein